MTCKALNYPTPPQTSTSFQLTSADYPTPRSLSPTLTQMQSSRIPHTSPNESTDTTSPSLVELHSMRARAIFSSHSLSLSAAAAIAENMRNQAQSPKVQHVLSSLLSLSLVSSVDPSSSNFESESETHRVQGTLKWSQWL